MGFFFFPFLLEVGLRVSKTCPHKKTLNQNQHLNKLLSIISAVYNPLLLWYLGL